jgi:hypothetical protein
VPKQIYCDPKEERFILFTLSFFLYYTGEYSIPNCFLHAICITYAYIYTHTHTHTHTYIYIYIYIYINVLEIKKCLKLILYSARHKFLNVVVDLRKQITYSIYISIHIPLPLPAPRSHSYTHTNLCFVILFL